jgi:hypothetical protein
MLYQCGPNNMVQNIYYYVDTACSSSTTTDAETVNSHMP